jgi:hypothetical protein
MESGCASFIESYRAIVGERNYVSAIFVNDVMSSNERNGFVGLVYSDGHELSVSIRNILKLEDELKSVNWPIMQTNSFQMQLFPASDLLHFSITDDNGKCHTQAWEVIENKYRSNSMNIQENNIQLIAAKFV